MIRSLIYFSIRLMHVNISWILVKLEYIREHQDALAYVKTD